MGAKMIVVDDTVCKGDTLSNGLSLEKTVEIHPFTTVLGPRLLVCRTDLTAIAHFKAVPYASTSVTPLINSVVSYLTPITAFAPIC